jgi:hypothetical protein
MASDAKLKKERADLLKSLRATAKAHVAAGESPADAMRLAVDDEIADAEGQLKRVVAEATPEPPADRNIRERLKR